MRLKQFIFALVAMLSLTFSVSAQTVSTAADLKNALSSTGAVVTLGDNITMTEVISIPQGISVTLDLNGKKITGNHSGYVFDITGSLTVKDSQGTGTVTGKSRVFTVKSKGSLTLNGGKFSKTSGQVIYTSGKLVVNGGVVETAPNATLNVNTAAITGAGGTVELKAGTVTSVVAQFCDLKVSGTGVTVTDGINVYAGAKGAEITAGTINGDVTIADEAKSKVIISGGSFEDKEAIEDCMEDGSALLQKPDGTYEIVAGLLKIGDTYYPTLDAAFKAAQNGATIELINQEGSVIAMNGSLYGKSVTITGTAKVDWSKGWLFVGRGGAGNATLTFDNANLTSVSNNASTGIHVSGREKGTADKYDGTVVIKNSTIVLDFLINKGAMTLDNSTLTVKNGFDLNGRPAKETENGEDANATLALANNSKLVVNNHNGMGIGREGKGELTVDASSTFEHTLDFLVCANGTMDVKGTLVSNGKKLTNNGEVKFTATKLTAATIEGTGTTRFYNEVNFYGANSITTTGINGTPFHLVINEGANLFITRFVLGYDRNITVNGTITDASAFNPAGQTPSLKFNSTSGVSVGGTGTGNLTVNNAYIELGNSSWKNAQGTYDWDFVNSYVSATSFTNATGADAATWDVTFDKSVLAAKNYIKNGNNVTYHFTNNSRGTTGSLRIDGVLNIDATSSVVTTSQQNNKVGAVDEHGGINGTVNVAGNLTIGSNAKTQLEVLGGTVNVDNGATLALGNNTMTLDAASALQSAGNISGAITAANGANVAITGGTYTQDVSNWCADGFMTQQNADGSFGIAKAAAKVGDKKYASLDEAVQAAKVGDKITLLDNADLAFAHNPQYNNVYASEIDLNGKTMTIKKGDVRFDNVTIKNGNIIVQPGTYNGTAIFLMYSKNLTFDGVKVTATGVAAAAYLIGLEGTSNLNLLNGSEIVINNESLVNIGSIIADNGNGNTVTIKDSKIEITNSNARLYLGGTNGNITVENSDIDLNGVKEGFYLRAGQTLAITGSSNVDIELLSTEGRYGINLTDLTATYTKAETATVNATVYEIKVAKVGENTYGTLAQAVAAVEDGGTITLIANETFTKNNRYNNGGWWDGLGYSGDKSFTIDLNNFTISQDGALNDYLMWFKNDGAKANTITLKNGTLDAGTTAYSALATASSNAQKITVNLENINVINNNSNGAALKIRGGSELNVKAGTIITGQNSYLGIEAVGKTTVVNIYEGTEIYQNGTSSYCGCLAGASGNSTINVYGGKGQSKSGGFIAMTSGGTINIEGGEWIANTDGTFANGNKSVLIAQSDKQYNAGAGNSIVNVTGGTFKGGYNCYGNKVGDAQIHISGGNFNADPKQYVEVGYVATEAAGIYTVVEAPAYIDGKASYVSLAAAYEAAVNGDVIVLNESVTTFPVIKKAVTFKGGKDNAAVEINYALSQNFTAIDGTVRFENLTFNKPLFTEHGGNKPGLSIEFEGCNFNVNSEAGYGILIGTSWSNSVVKGLKVNNCNFKYVGTEFKGGYMLYVQCVNEVTITNNTIDGNNLYRGAIHLGDATEHATVATVSNNTIKNFCRGVMMGNRKAPSSATISGNTFDNINYSDKDSKPTQECAPIFIHSNATAEALQIALTDNKVENCTNPMIYSEDTDLIKYYVTEFTGNTVGGAAVELANSYNAPNQIFPVATINDAEYFTLQSAVDAVKNGETIVLARDLTEDVTVTEKTGLYYTIDGAGKTMNGTINVKALSDTEDNRCITIKKINFVETDNAKSTTFISSVETNHYPHLTIEGCTFTGSGYEDDVDEDVAVAIKSAKGVVIKDCTGTGLHSFLQNTSGWNLTIEGVTVTNSNAGLALGTVQGVTIKGSTIDVATYGIRLDANTYNNNATIESNNVTAFIPVVVRKVNAESNVTFTGENTFTAKNTDGKWMVIGTTEYEENGKLPAEVATGNVVVALNGANLSYEGIHGAGLAGKGTAEAPYLINNIAELEIFRNSVNAGSTKYNAPGVWVALGADIDLANAEWTVGIGDGHNYSFDGNFDGKNHTIKNLNIKPYADADSYICGGLFGYTYGAVTIKNLVIENAIVNFATPETGKTYHNVGVLVGFANNKDGKLNVDNVIVKGDIKVNAPQTYGVGAIVGYSYREMGAITNTKVLANAGSYINAQRNVGGISGYSYDAAIINNCTVENLTLTGKIGVGGIAGLAKNGNKITQCTVNNVTVNGDNNVAYVVGELQGEGGNVTVAENVAPQPWVGGSWGSGESFVATIGTQYYTSIAKAIEAAKETDVISLITDVTASDIITINKAITLDGNGKTLTSTAGRAINVDCQGNVGIKNLTINASGERAINVIQKPANVTIENVTATAANYTVNLASSAGAAKVAISNSNLTGLNVVNVAAPGSEITISGGTITCNDNNANENYAALALNKDAVGAKIAATGVTFDIKGESKKASNGAVGGEITIDGKTEEVDVIVAYIQYGNYYNSYTSIEAAIAKAKDGETIGLIRNITASEIITINKAVTLDGKGKTLTSTAGRAINVDCEGNVGIKNLTINAKGERAINVIQKPANVTIDSVTATAANYTVNLATSAGAAKVAINGSKLTGLNVVNVSAPGAEVTIDGGSITCNDQNANENYAALVLSKEAKNGKITANGVTFDIKGDSKKASNAATGGVITIDGSTDDVSVVVAYINYGNNSYTFTSIEEAIKFAKAGDVVTIMPGEYNKALNVNKAGITVQGETDAEGNNLVKFNGKLNITANGAAVKNITVKNSGTAAYINAADVLVENCNLEGSNGLYQSYAKGTVTFKSSVITGGTYGVHFDGSTGGNIVIEGCTITGWTSFAGTIANVEISKTTFADGNYDQLRFYQNATLTECVFNENMTVDFGKNTIEAEFTECTVENGKPLTDVIYLGDIAEGVKVTIDDKPISVQAKAGKNYYQTLLEAVDSAKTGETVTLLTDVALDTKTLATQNDGYAVLVNVNGKKVTLDLNGKKITVNAAAADLASAKGGMLLGVFSADLNGHLTLTDNTDAKNGAVKLNVNDAKVYGMFVSESKESDKSNSGKITVNGGNYTTVGKVSNAMFFADANEVITVNGGNFHCDQVSNTANYPWMFNTVGNNEIHVIVNGGTFNVDINHQHRPFEVKVPETLAVKANGDGTWTVVPAEAYITEMLGATVNEAGEWGHKVGYATIAEAIAAVNELGNKVSIAKDLELTETVVVPADKTMVLDLNGKTVTMNDASGAAAALLKNNGNLTITDDTEAKAGKLSFKTTTPSAANAYASNTISNYGTLTIEGGNVENLSVGGGACYALDNYAGSTATINGGKLTAEKTAVRIFNWTDGEAAKATINMNGGEIYSKNGYGINVNSGNTPFVALNITGGTITTDYADYKLAVYVVNKANAENLTINVTGGTFNGIFALNGVTAQTMKQGAVAVSGGTFEGVTCYDDPAYGFVSGGTFKSAVDAKAVATGFICKDNGNGTFGVIVDPKHGKVAQIIRSDYYAENQYFATINDAVQAAQNGETVTLIADVETSAANLATITDNYAVIVAVKEKQVTIDLNGKNVTVTPTAEELANAEGKMLMSVFGMDTNGKLTLTGNGSVKVNANGANVYSLIAAYGEGSAVVIENGNYEVDTVIASGSLIYSHEMVTVMGGTYKLGNLATGANGSPWIFNTVGQNYTGVKVVGGTFPTDINHQFWANEVLVPEAYALKNNGDGIWTVVDAVAYTNEKATSRNASWRHVGYASLEDAIAATGKYNCQDNTVTMFKDITLEPITIANGVEVALDLNGKTISGTDNGTASYGLITNKGDLTINGTGAITLTATQDRGWSAFSSVISNQVGGKLTVNGGTIQHLGGTAMAWGIDNLTNGKGTYAETVINGGVVKSKYIAIRQFLNGVEADNILTVNGGTLEGETASLYFQDPSKNANTGTLNVLDGTLAGDVYLDVTEGSTEWPVEVYIAKDALGQNEIHADNVPAEAAALVEYDTFWQVEQKNLAELTIEDACDEYINKIEKNVGVLTYKRYFDDTEWQTIVLPFDVPVANLTEQFEVAYIYNASYKGENAVIDFVVIDENSAIETLRANYPYMIRAKEAGWNNIVVEGAKLMPTEVEILDCSSVFEKFSFIGSYATVNTETLDATKGYFNLISGAWSQLGTVNPFRFYMQIEKRDGSAFEYPGTEAKAIRMRQVNANGEATGIDSVGAVTEQNSGLIFDLHGRRVVEPKKGGLYIVNGKKVVF